MTQPSILHAILILHLVVN